MTLNMNFERISAGVLLAYLAAYFIVPYKPWLSPISFPTPLLGIWVILYGLNLIQHGSRGGFCIPRDLILFSLTVGFFGISAGLVHFAEFLRPNMQAYALSFLCFFFVRTAIRNVNIKMLFIGMKAYLMVSGVLILLQICFAGVFYVAGLLGQTNFGKLTQGWGFGNTHIWAGGAIAWMLSIVLTKYAISYKDKFSLSADFIDLCSVSLGAAGLFFTLNRGAWLGVALAMLLMAVIIIRAGLSVKRLLIGLAVMFVFTFACKITLRPDVYNMHEKLSFFNTFMSKDEPDTLESARSVQIFPGENGRVSVADPSSLTRLKAWGVAVDGIKKHPFWGLGIGQYPKFYEKAYPGLFKGLEPGQYDPNTKQIPHNSYLYYAFEAGLLPAAFLFLFIIMTLFNAFKLGAASTVFPFFVGGVVICVWILTCDFINERIFWIALGVVSGLSAISPNTSTEVRRHEG